MSGIQIDARGVQAAMAGLSEKRVRRVVTAGVNEVGKTLRKRIPAELEGNLQARKIRSRTKAQAAFAGSATPRYRLDLPKFVGIHDLRTLRFKTTGRGANRRVKMTFKGFGGNRLTFGAVAREGKGRGRRVKLLAAGDKPERLARGPQIPRTILSDKRRFPGVDQAVKAGREAAIARMQAALAKAGRSRR